MARSNFSNSPKAVFLVDPGKTSGMYVQDIRPELVSHLLAILKGGSILCRLKITTRTRLPPQSSNPTSSNIDAHYSFHNMLCLSLQCMFRYCYFTLISIMLKVTSGYIHFSNWLHPETHWSWYKIQNVARKDENTRIYYEYGAAGQRREDNDIFIEYIHSTAS